MTQCSAKTLKNKQCLKTSVNGFKYCVIHQSTKSQNQIGGKGVLGLPDGFWDQNINTIAQQLIKYSEQVIRREGGSREDVYILAHHAVAGTQKLINHRIDEEIETSTDRKFFRKLEKVREKLNELEEESDEEESDESEEESDDDEETENRHSYIRRLAKKYRSRPH
jgi:hypothetical protein